jgi:hypothetical protein
MAHMKRALKYLLKALKKSRAKGEDLLKTKDMASIFGLSGAEMATTNSLQHLPFTTLLITLI